MGNVYQLPKLAHPDFALPGVKPKGPVIPITDGIGRDLYEIFLYQGADNDGLIRRIAEVGSTQAQQIADHRAFDGSSEFYDYGSSHDDIDSLSNFSVTVIITLLSTPGADAVLSSRIDSSHHQGWTLFHDVSGPNGSNVFDFYIRPGSGSSLARSSPSISHGAGNYVVTGTFDGDLSNPNKSKTYVNGVDETDGSSTGTITDVGSGETLLVGAHSNSGDRRFWPDEMSAVFIHKRTLSAREMVDWHADIYREIFEPSIPVTYFTPDGVAPSGRTMGSLAAGGGLAGIGGIAGRRGGIAG